MDIGNALIGFFIAIPFLDEVIGAAHEHGTIATRADLGDLPYPGLGQRNVAAALDRPVLTTVDAPFQPLIRLTGTLELRAPGDPEGDILETRPLELGLRLDPVVTGDADDVPVVGFRATGAEPPIAPAELAPFIDFLIAAPQLQAILADFRLPLFEDLIDAAAGALFPSGGGPGPASFAMLPTLLPGTSGTAPCIAAFVGEPGTTLAPGLPASPVAEADEIGIGYSETFLNLSLATGAAAQVGETVDGAEIQSLSLVMGDGVINVDGRAEKDGADITFTGPITLSFRRASSTLITNADQVDVDVDLPWYLWFFTAVAFLFGPIIGMIFTGEVVFPALDDASEAPEKVRGGLVGTLTKQLARLVTALSDTDSFAGIDGYAITDSARFEANGMAFFAEVIVRPFETEIVDARRYRSLWYQKYDAPFQEFDLANGRTYPTRDLALLLIRDLVRIPGYHGVDGPTRLYVRGNPDGAPGNNLDERFPGSVEPDFG